MPEDIEPIEPEITDEPTPDTESTVEAGGAEPDGGIPDDMPIEVTQ